MLKKKETLSVDPNYGPKGEAWSTQVPEVAKSLDREKYPDGYMIEPPSEDPAMIYAERSVDYPFQEIALNEKWTQIPMDGQGDDREKSLEIIEAYFNYQRHQFLGYQCAEQIKISQDIAPFLNLSLNNVGDPFTNGYYTINAKQAERSVLDFYASLWHAKWPSLPKPKRRKGITDEVYLMSEEYTDYKESYWGYILSMGSTEGNLYSVLSARDYLSGFSLVVDVDTKDEFLCLPNMKDSKTDNEYTPVAFYSYSAHYSLAKAVHAMGVKTFYQIAHENKWECPIEGEWPESVPVNMDGSVKVDDLVTLVEFFVKKGYPPFICFNYGTTFKGAYDNITDACKNLNSVLVKDRKVKYTDKEGVEKTDHRRGYWIHVDGALGASLMPFVEMAAEHSPTAYADDLAPCFDFRNDDVMSIVTSGHKWPGAPAPTGVYMSKNKYLITPVATPDYLGSTDTTFAGSRSGLSAMALWNLIAKEGISGFVEKAKRTMDLCRYAENKFKELQKKLGIFDIWLHRAPNGGTSLIFRKPIDTIMFKYSLPIEVERTNVEGGIRKQTFVHMFIFWDRDESMIDSLVKALEHKDAFDPKADSLIQKPPKSKKLNTNIKTSTSILSHSKHKGFR